MLLSKILRWITYPVEPFGFGLVQTGLSSPALEGNPDRLRKPPGLLDEANDCLANKLH
jgi:hypothetical protein